MASSATGLFGYPVGKEGALALNYDPELLDDLSDQLLDSFCGVGNPFSLGPIKPGSQVLDVGCGGGFDLYVATTHIGDSGRAVGVDLTQSMVNRAKSNLTRLLVQNAEVHHIKSENLPFENSSFDHVISNGVINLSPSKRQLFQEIYRVLKPGGFLQFADIILDKELPPNLATDVESWSQ